MNECDRGSVRIKVKAKRDLEWCNSLGWLRNDIRCISMGECVRVLNVVPCNFKKYVCGQWQDEYDIVTW